MTSRFVLILNRISRHIKGATLVANEPTRIRFQCTIVALILVANIEFVANEHARLVGIGVVLHCWAWERSA